MFGCFPVCQWLSSRSVFRMPRHPPSHRPSRGAWRLGNQAALTAHPLCGCPPVLHSALMGSWSLQPLHNAARTFLPKHLCSSLPALRNETVGEHFPRGKPVFLIFFKYSSSEGKHQKQNRRVMATGANFPAGAHKLCPRGSPQGPLPSENLRYPLEL